jgi:hypothetical protein
MLSEEDQSADHALVSDGMRPGDHTLPPYHPGNRRMSGHGGDNEMRLSGYVKGQTRAQDMKDSGRYWDWVILLVRDRRLSMGGGVKW